MMMIDAKEVLQRLTPTACVPLMRDTLQKLARGESRQFLRTAVPLPNTNILGLMPCSLDDRYFGAKVLSVYHTNTGTGFPSHQGSVLVFESQHGSLVACVDASSITQVRTGAVSAVATDLLARRNASTLALLGSGAQARSHLEAIASVRMLQRVTVWDIRRDWSETFAREMGAKLGLTIAVCDTVEEAVCGAEIICTVTAAKTPILKGEWICPGAHINAVGACSAKDREVDTETVVRARLYCDAMESLLNEAGDYLIPRAEGAVDDGHIVGTLGDALLGTIPGRQSDEEITMFEAQGLAVEDLAAAVHLCRQNAD